MFVVFTFCKAKKKWFSQPVFLHRSLSYMKGRISGRDHKKRSAFKVDSILESKTTACNNAELGTFKYMTLTFLGFYDSKG